jgi:hypothetical protein
MPCKGAFIKSPLQGSSFLFVTSPVSRPHSYTHFIIIILIEILADEVGELSPIPAMNRDNDVNKLSSDSFLLRGVVIC